MKLKYKLAIFIAFQPFLTMFDRFLYTFFYINGFDFIQIAILEILYSAMALTTLFLLGNYSDIKGRKGLIPILMGYYSIFPLIYIRFRTFILTSIVRFSEGIKHAYFPIYHSITQDLSPKKKIGMYFGFVTAIFSIGGLIRPILGGFIIDMFGFEMLAFLTSITIILFCVFFIKNFPETLFKGKGMYRRLRIRIVKNRFILAYSVYQFIIIYVFITNWIYLPIKSFDIMKSFVGVGAILFAGQIVFTVGQIPFGAIADKVGIFKVYIFGMIFSSVTSFLLGFVNQGMLLLIVNLFAGLAASLIRPVEKAMIAKNIPESRRAEFNSMIHIFLNLGVIFGVVLATIMILVFNINYVFYLQSVVFLIAPIAFFVTYGLSKPNVAIT